jgi:hypothetical protein
MKNKKLLISSVILVCLILICLGVFMINSHKTKTISSSKITSIKITDPKELERLWQGYINDTITTLGNGDSFTIPQKKDTYSIVCFCAMRYKVENNISSLPETNGFQAFPLKTALQYAERYFNLKILDVSSLDTEQYDSKTQTFLVNIGSDNRTRPTYSAMNDFGIKLKQILKYSDDTYEVLLEQNNTTVSRPERTYKFTLKERKDKSLYFLSFKNEWINLSMVSLKGDFTQFDKIKGYDGNFASDTIAVGEIKGNLLLRSSSSEKNKSNLFIFNPKSFTALKTIRLDNKNNDSIYGVKLCDDKIIICSTEKIIILNSDLSKNSEMQLPSTITNKINRTQSIDKNGYPNVYFAGYDISNDLNKIVYSDEIGLKLLDIATKKEILLSKNNKTHNNYYPKFVDNQEKVISTNLGYESITGYTFYNTANKTSKNIIFSDYSTSNIVNSSGMIGINSYNQKDGYKSYYLDFNSGKVTDIKLQNAGINSLYRLSGYDYVGKNYGAFITLTSSDKGDKKTTYNIDRINLKTLQIEYGVVNVDAVGGCNLSITGVTDDGRILFSYEKNPAEKGICISTKSMK